MEWIAAKKHSGEKFTIQCYLAKVYSSGRPPPSSPGCPGWLVGSPPSSPCTENKKKYPFWREPFSLIVTLHVVLSQGPNIDIEQYALRVSILVMSSSVYWALQDRPGLSAVQQIIHSAFAATCKADGRQQAALTLIAHWVEILNQGAITWRHGTRL